MDIPLTSESNLLNGLGFTADDLAANRDGRLSEAQKSVLRGHRWLRARGYFVLALFMALIAAVPGLRYFQSTVKDGYDLFGAVVFAGFAVLLLGIGINRWQRVQKDIQNGVVNHVNGKAKLRIKRTGRGLYDYKLKVEGHDFELSKDALLVFTEGQSYRVYYTPIAQVVVAAEEV